MKSLDLDLAELSKPTEESRADLLELIDAQKREIGRLSKERETLLAERERLQRRVDRKKQRILAKMRASLG